MRKILLAILSAVSIIALGVNLTSAGTVSGLHGLKRCEPSGPCKECWWDDGEKMWKCKTPVVTDYGAGCGKDPNNPASCETMTCVYCDTHQADNAEICVFDNNRQPTVALIMTPGTYTNVSFGVENIPGKPFKLKPYGLPCTEERYLCIVNNANEVPKHMRGDTVLKFTPVDRETGQPIPTIPFCEKYYPPNCVNDVTWPNCGTYKTCSWGNRGNVFGSILYIFRLPNLAYLTELSVSYTPIAIESHGGVVSEGSGYTLIADMPAKLGLRLANVSASVRVWYRPYTCTKGVDSNGNPIAICTEGNPQYVDVPNPQVVATIIDGSIGDYKVNKHAMSAPDWKVMPVIASRGQRTVSSFVYRKQTLGSDPFPNSGYLPRSTSATYTVQFYAAGLVTLPRAFTTCGNGGCSTHDYTSWYSATQTVNITFPVRGVDTSRGR